MRERIKAIVKSSRFVYNTYFVLGSFALKFIGFFIKLDPNLLLFVSYGGQKYDDSPRVVYELLKEKPISSQHRYVWAFDSPDKVPEVIDKVKIDTVRYYITALKAGYWITNSSASRGLDYKKKNTKKYIIPARNGRNKKNRKRHSRN